MPQDPSIPQYGTFWARLGLRGQTSRNLPPEIVPTIQPVVIAGDATQISPYFDVACGIWAVQGGAVAGQFAGGQLRANNPGGIIVDWWVVKNPAVSLNPGTSFYWWVGPVAAFIAAGGGASLGAVISSNPNRPCTATSGTYHGAASLIGTLSTPADVPEASGADDKAAVPVNDGHAMGPVWIAPGNLLFCQTFNVQNGIRISGWFRELPAASPPPPP